MTVRLVFRMAEQDRGVEEALWFLVLLFFSPFKRRNNWLVVFDVEPSQAKKIRRVPV